MPNKEYKFTRKAVQDISSIWNYTYDNWSKKQADKYYSEIINQCQRLTINPNLGRTYEGIVSTLKGIKVNEHIIFYRVLKTQDIEIERILHQRMDLSSQIKK